jgi:hypothetical protein
MRSDKGGKQAGTPAQAQKRRNLQVPLLQGGEAILLELCMRI